MFIYVFMHQLFEWDAYADKCCSFSVGPLLASFTPVSSIVLQIPVVLLISSMPTSG